MIIILKSKKATKDQIKKMAHEYGNYIKVVVDIEKDIVAGGSAFHYEEEQGLLEYGCEQKNLWGGGIDINTGAIDYDSMINVRPIQDNQSRIILSQQIKDKFDKIVKELIPV